MKKIILIAVAVVIVITLIAVAIASKSNKKDSINDSENRSSSSTGFIQHRACDILTNETAQLLLGANAAINDTSAPTGSTSSVSVTSCSYSNLSTKDSATVLSKSVLTQAGADANKKQFTNSLPNDAQKITGYDYTAYWSQSNGQLSVLKHNNWYVLSIGPVKPAARQQYQAELLALATIDPL